VKKVFFIFMAEEHNMGPLKHRVCNRKPLFSESSPLDRWINFI